MKKISSQIHGPFLGDKVDYGIGLSEQPVRLHWPVCKHHAIVNFILLVRD
jgi:hypothetical protein